jgi:hypothetical protein
MAMRRPLPALVSLLALLLLTALVWWRVLNRGDGSDKASACPKPSASTSAPPTVPGPASVTVTVLNATTRNGIAAKARQALLADGFKVPALAANDPSKVKIPGPAQIRFGPAGKDGAKLLSYYFPGAALVPNTGASATVAVSLGQKYIAVATAAQVKAAMARDKITVATPSPTPTPSGSASC